MIQFVDLDVNYSTRVIIVSEMWTQLTKEAMFLRTHWLAEASWRTRRSQWKHYMTFCTELNVTPLPATPELVCLYIAYMVRSFKFVSIINYVSALRVLHKCYLMAPVSPDNFLVSSTLLGAKRLLGDEQFSSDPLLPRHLSQIYETLDIKRQEDLVFWTALITCFRGLLRKSSVCQGPNCMKRSDIIVNDWGALIHIRKSKTIQFKERVHVIPVARVSGLLCAVSWLEKMYSSVRVTPDKLVFGIFKCNAYKPLTYDWFTKKLKTCIRRAGLSRSGKFTSHSLRRGGATALAMAGVPLHDIQKYGDWKSLSVLLYLASPLEHRIAQEKVIAPVMVQVGMDHPTK